MKFIQSYDSFKNITLNESSIINPMEPNREPKDKAISRFFQRAKMYMISKYNNLESLIHYIDIIEVYDDKLCPTAQTDGQYIYYNPNFFHKENVVNFENIGFVYYHELLHIYFEHFKRPELAKTFNEMQKDHNKLNIAMDIIIDNVIEKESNVFKVIEMHKEFIGNKFETVSYDDMLLMIFSDNLTKVDIVIKKYGLDKNEVYKKRKYFNKKQDDNSVGGSGSGSSGSGSGSSGSGSGSSDGGTGSKPKHDGLGNDVIGDKLGESLQEKLGLPNKDKSGLDNTLEDVMRRQDQEARQKGSGSSGNAYKIKIEERKEKKAKINWKTFLSGFLKKTKVLRMRMYKKNLYNQSGIIMRTPMQRTVDAKSGDQLYIFLDTSGSISPDDFNIFVSELANAIQKNNISYVEVIPFSVGIHLEGKVVFGPRELTRKLDYRSIVKKLTGQSGGKSFLVSKDGNNNTDEIFKYVENEIGNTYDKDVKIVVFSDAGFEGRFAKYKPDKLKDDQILWVLYTEQYSKLINFGTKIFYNKL